MWMLIGFASLIASIVFVIMGIISKVKKKDSAKKRLLIALATFILFIVAIVASPDTDTEAAQESPEASQTVSSVTPDPKVEADKKQEEEAAKAAADLKEKQDAEKAAKEAEIKAAEEAARKAKSIDGNGTFAVNDEVKPGLYRAKDGITYWARTKGFSGDMGELLANGIPSGSVIVEIKATDVGFKTMGSGTWELVDDSYNPDLLTEFSDGMYLVGKDISPGTYTSGDSVTYWARLKDFTGDMNSISANGIPQGPEIVEIKASDKGFVTQGGGTWKKIK